MSKDRKSFMSGGLAFAEEEDMQKLSDLAKEGWILDSFKYLSYQLKKSEPQDLVYCVDFNFDKKDLQSYFEIFEDSDWEHVCSYDGYHFFKAPPGTVPIYTDEYTKNLKYKKLYKLLDKNSKYMLILALVLGLMSYALGNIASSESIFKGVRIVSYTGFFVSLWIGLAMFVCNIFIKKKIVGNKLSDENIRSSKYKNLFKIAEKYWIIFLLVFALIYYILGNIGPLNGLYRGIRIVASAGIGYFLALGIANIIGSIPAKKKK